MVKEIKEIIIRKAKKGDGKGWVKMWNEGIKRKFFLYNGGNSLKGKKDILKADKRYSTQNKNNFTFLAIEKETGIIVGACNAFGNEKGRARHRAECGWMVHPDYSGNGIATELLKEVIKEAEKNGLKRLEAEAASINEASIRLAKRLRFKIEGKRRAGLLTDKGKYLDTYLFGKVLQ